MRDDFELVLDAWGRSTQSRAGAHLLRTPVAYMQAVRRTRLIRRAIVASCVLAGVVGAVLLGVVFGSALVPGPRPAPDNPHDNPPAQRLDP